MTRRSRVLHVLFLSLMVGAFSSMVPTDQAVAKGPPEHQKAGKSGKAHGHGKKSEKHDKSAKGKPAKARHGTGSHESGSTRKTIREYYAAKISKGHCPPGLAKKNNGCQPPGQAKKWQVGQPLPADVVTHEPPDDLLHRVGRTPEGEKLVRVGADILKIEAGTGMVLEAIEDLEQVLR